MSYWVAYAFYYSLQFGLHFGQMKLQKFIFNADAKKIGRFMDDSDADDFINRVEEKSAVDEASNSLKERWNNGEHVAKMKIKSVLSNYTQKSFIKKTKYPQICC